MNFIIGIDAGATTTVVSIGDAGGKKISEIKTHGANLHAVSDAEFVSTISKAIAAAMRHARVAGSPKAVCFGIAGLDSDSDVRHARILSAKIFPKLNHKKIVIVNDIETAWAANVRGENGIVLISGTGSHAFGRNVSGECAHVGGMDWLLSDEGSAFEVGREVLRAVVRSEDGRAPSLLEKIVKKKLLVRSMRDTIRLWYGMQFNKAAVAQFSVFASVAAKRGDRVAMKILEQAADDLALMVKTLIQRLALQRTKVELITVGSQINHDHYIRRRFIERIHKKFPLIETKTARRQSVDGALSLAARAIK